MRKVLVFALLVACVAASPAAPGTPRSEPSGDPIVSPELPLTATGSSRQFQPSLAFDGTNYLAAWSEYRAPGDQVYAGRLSALGEPLDGSGFVVGGHGNLLLAPVVVSGGENYLVAWTDCYHYMEIDRCSLYTARVSREGDVLDPSGIPMPVGDDWFSDVDKAVAFDGTNYLVVWGTGGKISAARVSQDGVVLDPQGFTIWTGGRLPAVAFDGTNYLVAWEQYVAGDHDIVAVRVRPDGTVLDPYGIPVAPTAGEQQEPRIASTRPASRSRPRDRRARRSLRSRIRITWPSGRSGRTEAASTARGSVAMEPCSIPPGSSSRTPALPRSCRTSSHRGGGGPPLHTPMASTPNARSSDSSTKPSRLHRRRRRPADVCLRSRTRRNLHRLARRVSPRRRRGLRPLPPNAVSRSSSA